MFSVYKHQSALNDLQSAWSNSDAASRVRIEAAMVDVERQLQESPADQGESRTDRARVLFHFPIAVMFEIDETRRLVNIVRAWTFRRLAA